MENNTERTVTISEALLRELINLSLAHAEMKAKLTSVTSFILSSQYYDRQALLSILGMNPIQESTPQETTAPDEPFGQE